MSARTPCHPRFWFHKSIAAAKSASGWLPLLAGAAPKLMLLSANTVA